MSLFESVKWWLLAPKRPAETQKKLPAPDTIKCGLCDSQIPSPLLFSHWLTHRGMYVSPLQVANHEGVMRSAPVVHHMVFIVRRPVYTEEHKRRLNLEETTEGYFAFAILALQQQYPWMRFFQSIPVCRGTSGEYLKTLLITAEWYQE